MTDSSAAQLLALWSARHGGQMRPGCSLVAHRDLGMCSNCISPHDGLRNGPEREMAAWRLLAMVERGMPKQPWEKP